MANLLDMNTIKQVVHVFDSVCSNVVRSLVKQYNLWYVLTTLETTDAVHCNCCWFIM